MFLVDKDKSYYSCRCLEETVVVHRDWYCICSMYGHFNSIYRPIFDWDENGFDYKNYLKVKRNIIKDMQNGKIHKGCIGCKDLVKKEWSGRCDKIYHIHFRLSKKCNAKCLYCCDDVDNVTPDRSFFNDLKILVKKNILAKDALMEFGGGEFTLHYEFDKILRFLLDNGFYRYKIYTSCLRYIPDFEEALSHGKCEMIVSADAGDRDTFIKIKQADTYNRFWKNLEKYAASQNKNQMQVQAKYIIYRGVNDSEQQIDLFLEKVKSIGIKKVIFDFEIKDIHSLQVKPDENIIKYLYHLKNYAKKQAIEKYGLIYDEFIYIQFIEKMYADIVE